MLWVMPAQSGKALGGKDTAVVGFFTHPALQWSGLVPTTLSHSPQEGVWPWQPLGVGEALLQGSPC